MSPHPAFIIGVIVGVVLTLVYQARCRAKAARKAAVAIAAGRASPADQELRRMKERIAVLEEIATDPAPRTERAIDALR